MKDFCYKASFNKNHFILSVFYVWLKTDGNVIYKLLPSSGWMWIHSWWWRKQRLGWVMRSPVADRLHLKCDGTRAETRFRLSSKGKSPFKPAGASVQLTIGNRGVRISGSNAGYTMFRGSVRSSGYPLHSQVSPSVPLPCVTMCHHISTGL
jgi:hypothetical protein